MTILPQDGPGARPVIAVCGMAFEAGIAAGPGVLALCGLGSAGLAARVDAIIRSRDVAGIISFGTACGLDPALAPGDCVIATGIADGGMRHAVDAAWLDALAMRLPAAARGLLAGVDAPLVDAAGKARLREASGAVAADMESHHAARIAARCRLPYAACRVLIDPAARSLPPAALAGLSADGTTALGPLLLSLASRPGQLPALLRLALDARAASRGLRAARAHLNPGMALPAREQARLAAQSIHTAPD